MSAITKFITDAFASGRKAEAEPHFNLAHAQERNRFRHSMPGEAVMTAATRLYANGR